MIKEILNLMGIICHSLFSFAIVIAVLHYLISFLKSSEGIWLIRVFVIAGTGYIFYPMYRFMQIPKNKQEVRKNED